MAPAKRFRFSILLLVLCLGLLYGFLYALQALQSKASGNYEKRTALVSFPYSPKAPQIKAEMADTMLSRAIGLMNRTYMAEDEGMLFIFEKPQKLSFWMKDTLISLDMIFIGPDKRIVSISADAKPCSIICPPHSSKGEAMYAVEVNGGFAEKYGIKPGDTVKF